MKNFTVTRIDALLFNVQGNFPYWSDGSAINMRAAFNGSGLLSNTAAQEINNNRGGEKYIIVNALAIGTPAVLAAARSLEIGSSVSVLL